MLSKSSMIAGMTAMLALAGCRCFEPTCIDHYHVEAAYPFDASAAATQSPDSYGQASDQREAEAPLPPPRAADSDRPLAERQPEPLKLPPELPGADAPPLRLPPLKLGEPDEQRREAVRRLYPPLPSVSELPAWNSDLDGLPLTLDRLQQLALENSPILRQAAANVEAARGAMIQAGAYPNPELGYQADTIGTVNTSGYHGGFLQQTFVTGGKLRLAQAAAAVDLENARIGMRKARVEVATNVRTAYFAELVARERLKLARALAKFSEQIYQAQIDLVQGGESAPYEPMQLRVFSLQARAAVVQATRQYQSQWRQLAAAIGLPQLPPTKVQGRVDMPVPVVDYEQAIAIMLANHTDLAIAANSIGQAGTLLRLAQVTPIPNIDTLVVVQRDNTFFPGATTVNLQVGGEIPVFNRNRGNIIAAQAQLHRAEQTVDQVRNDLTGALADAFARYEASRVLAESFRVEALRTQVSAYRGIYQRYRSDPAGVQFNDVVVAQQVLGATLTQYIDVLGDQWQAVVDVAELMQVEDVYTLGPLMHVAPIPVLEVPSEEIPLPVP